MPDFYIRQVQSEAERLAILRLRYEVFVEECGDMRYALHEEKLHRDSADNNKCCTLAAFSNANDVIGTARLVPRRNGPYFGEAFYHYNLLAERVGISIGEVLERTGIISRAAVKREFRHHGIFRAMCAHLEEDATESHISIMVGAVDVSNATALKIFYQLGYQLYGTWTNQDNWTGNYIFKVLDDQP